MENPNLIAGWWLGKIPYLRKPPYLIWTDKNTRCVISNLVTVVRACASLMAYVFRGEKNDFSWLGLSSYQVWEIMMQYISHDFTNHQMLALMYQIFWWGRTPANMRFEPTNMRIITSNRGDDWVAATSTKCWSNITECQSNRFGDVTNQHGDITHETLWPSAPGQHMSMSHVHPSCNWATLMMHWVNVSRTF